MSQDQNQDQDASKPKSRRGGKRPGAGRPPKALNEARRFLDLQQAKVEAAARAGEAEIRAVERRIANAVETVIETEIDLARELVRLKNELPRLVANLSRLADGGYEQVVETWEPGPVGPDGAPGPLKLVNRKVTWAAPDRAANIYLVDRILGRPTERHEVGGASDGPPIKVYVGVDVDRV